MYDIFHVPGIIAPAGKLRPDKFDTGVAYLRATGREPRFGAHVNGPSDTAYLSADAEARASDLTELWLDPKIDLLLAVGGAIYSVGAVFYALRRPNPWPTVFGHHEFFHACTLVAAICHHIAIYFALFA